MFKKLYFSFPVMISFDFQVEEEASDKDNKNCSNNGKQQTFLCNSDSRGWIISRVKLDTYSGVILF